MEKQTKVGLRVTLTARGAGGGAEGGQNLKRILH